ncbi:MAG: hypothetical protein Q8T03_06075 [Bacteroidota bacterium]|nr:hypothetical protein [Bacteroidota bacterium]
MKISILIISTLLYLKGINYSNLIPVYNFNAVFNCDSLPLLNKNIVAFAKSKIGKKVGKGECWDFAAEALNYTGATWDGNYKFGKEVNFKKDCVFPGDIIQFEGVSLKYEIDKKKYMENLSHHTAIIFEVKSKEEFILADQNTGRSGRKVGLSPFDVKTITKGKFKIFRPTN